MKDFVAIVALSFVVCVQGQKACTDDRVKISDCVQSCIQDAHKAVGCAIDDVQCQCDPARQADIYNAAYFCLGRSCVNEGYAQLKSALAQGCSCAATVTVSVNVGLLLSTSRSTIKASATPKGKTSPAPTTKTAKKPSSPARAPSKSARTSSAAPSPTISSSPTSPSSPAAVPNQSTKINGPTIAIAVSTSIGTIALIVAIFLIRRYRIRRRGRRREAQIPSVMDKEVISDPNLIDPNLIPVPISTPTLIPAPLSISTPIPIVNHQHPCKRKETYSELYGDQGYELQSNSNSVVYEMPPQGLRGVGS